MKSRDECRQTSDGEDRRRLIRVLLVLLVGILCLARADAAPPAPVTNLKAEDVPNDDGTALHLSWTLSPDDATGATNRVAKYQVLTVIHRERGSFSFSALLQGRSPFLRQRVELPTVVDVPAGTNETILKDQDPHAVYRLIKVLSLGPDGTQSESLGLSAQPAVNWFNWSKLWFAILTIAICGTVILCTELARRGRPFYVRPIAGLTAIQEAVGRATEMGKPMLFVPGIQDMNEIDTVAGLTVLSSVAKTAAEYDTRLEVPTARSLVMAAAREGVQAAYLSAGRPDSYREENIYYITDEQFGYVASVCGWMYREHPATCFFLGKFYAESLILAETGNAVGAIQIAGTAETTQLPFFVAACDYTLLGEELFAASAYLSGEPAQLGMLKGQDFGKLMAIVLIVVGCLLATWDSIQPRKDADGNDLPARTGYLRDKVLKGG